MGIFGGVTKPRGNLKMKVNRIPRASFLWKLSNFLNVWRGLWRFAIADFFGISTFKGRLYLTHIKKCGTRVHYGLVSTRLVTTAFVEYLVDNLVAEVAAFGDFQFHDSGIGTTAAAVGNTDIETTDGQARTDGTQLEGASGEIYRSVGTIAYDASYAITEHGLFNIITGGILMDRHVFAAVNVVDGDSIEFTYELTVDDGG